MDAYFNDQKEEECEFFQMACHMFRKEKKREEIIGERKNLRMSEKSSTRMISCIRWSGDLSSTEWTVLSNTDQASL